MSSLASDIEHTDRETTCLSDLALGELLDYLLGLVGENTAAGLANSSPRTMQGYRLNGGGPPFIKLGPRSVGYRRIDLFLWLEEHLRRSTSDISENIKPRAGVDPRGGPLAALEALANLSEFVRQIGGSSDVTIAPGTAWAKSPTTKAGR